MSNNQPKISIITVVFNSEKFIERTILSVINAKKYYQNIEYLIIDGASKDKTIEIITKYKNQIDYLNSEPDKGLYDAMNKGLDISTGEYIWFLNSGDKIHIETTVKQIFESSIQPQDVYYGETIMVDENEQVIGMRRHTTPLKLTWKSFKQGMKVSHQSIIFKKKLVTKYDLKYRFSADFDWCIKALKKSQNIQNTNLIFTSYLEGGLTKHNIIAGLKERFRIMTIHYGLTSTIFNHIPLGLKFLWYFLINRRF
jgi:glycosyltransferase involved in cell wall biosynthesis